MTVALLILAGVWLGATLGNIFAGIMLMGRDVVAHVDLRSARWVEVTISHDRRRLWINSENGLVCRVHGIETLILPGEGADYGGHHDRRPDTDFDLAQRHCVGEAVRRGAHDDPPAAETGVDAAGHSGAQGAQDCT